MALIAPPEVRLRAAITAQFQKQKYACDQETPERRQRNEKRYQSALLYQFDFSGGKLLLAVHGFDRAGGGNFLGFLAEILVKVLAHVILYEVIAHLFMVFFYLNDILTFLGFLK
jgi:hypothetical protein